MTHYLVRRLLWMIVVVFGVSIVVFGLIHLTPGDPARIMLGPAGRPEDIAKLRHQLGLDRSVAVQYVRWVSRALRGDLGQSIVLRRPVLGEVLDRFGNTAILATASILISFLLGIVLGVVSAVRRGSVVDRLVMLAATWGLSLPSFWFGLMLIILFSLRLKWLPGTGMTSAINGGGPLDVGKHLILPAVALSVVPMAVIARYTRSSMLEVLSQDYVRTARAKGLSEQVVIWRHVFRNTLVAIVTMLGLQIGFLLAGAVYIENVFSWPGIGQMLVDAILKRDFPLVQGGVLLVASVYVLVNLLTDLAYAYLDPRIRLV
ncbi:MAG: peptide/nickel transport system permease protein [Thermomicrobiales bacterium]|jgi:peptide/nickel transport system permease protein|nr:peptide/nickel transport system permease protein [Thermomicrobiales bacterium]MEA2586462.1 peptide/nickel transport system permease protein [Thermomicrobiales bacterium]MEA2597162.1 peptide/nickel transport system permease protein [Thermomicrobiales bacterium]